ncbi:glycosyltransferase [Zhihengliuella flava]|uniref:Lipopolysaccharide biosynthesis glycosyltransferase n=1 Tax=Zhihengliuella flava TaxID=1285193 RepID=A0A931DEM7_9MICC|nr:glycosyltransferase [Zhihengliuella flava]MBG6085425.1 lipopolysaccharide biosynthesis glycosyltransferase [Zhihengliuella flava]
MTDRQENLPLARLRATAMTQGKRLARATLNKITSGVDRAQEAREQQGGRPSDAEVRRLEGQIERLQQQLADARLFRSAVSSGLTQVQMPLSRTQTPAQARRHALKAIKSLGGQAVLGQELEHGNPLDVAIMRMVRKLLANKQHVRARSIGHSLLKYEGTEGLGHAAVGLVAMYQSLIELAEHHFDALTPDEAARLVPAEWMDVQFRRDPAAAVASTQEHAAQLLATDELRFEAVALALREHQDEFARTLYDQLRADRADAPALSARALDEYAWLQSWFEMTDREAAGQPAWHDDAVNIGVLDYKHADFTRQSANIGDYIQTIGSMTHLTRFTNLEFHGHEDLTSTAELLQSRTRGEFRSELETPAKANLVRLDRDDTGHNHIPDNTWMLAFGWYMHPPFKGEFNFPFAENVNPIFVSFHIQRREMLTDAAIAYLKKHGPIGCRDWTTVYLLRGVGVEAFFSGCLTTTVDAVFEDPSGVQDPERVAVVDKNLTSDIRALVPAGSTVDVITQASPEVGRSPLGPNVREALELLDRYRYYGKVITSRLHCYLPATALGCTVEFTPGRDGDVRFDGLHGLTPGSPDLAAIQNGLRAKLESVYRLILSGADRDAVYTHWRELTADDVAAANEYASQPFELPKPQFDVASACQTILEGRADFASGISTTEPAQPDDVHVALATDANLRYEVPVVVESILKNASQPVHFWVLTRDLRPDYFAALAETFPQARFTFLPCDRVQYGDIAGMLQHITVSTMDRLLLPLLLPDLDRVVYHDIDAVTLADIADLYNTDLGENPIAARSSRASWAESGFGNVYRAANRLDRTTAARLRRGMHEMMPYDFTTFNAGILVMDLAHMRKDDFCHRYVGMAGEFGMNDQEILNCYTGPKRTVLDIRWNSVPQQEVVEDPWLIHWAGPAKPWRPEYVVLQEVWDELVESLHARAAAAGTLTSLLGHVPAAGSSAASAEDVERDPLEEGESSDSEEGEATEQLHGAR